MKTDINGFITELDENEIFVFGSNLAGEHIGGAARTAKEKFGAIEGQGIGWQGQSYAIPTLDRFYKKLPLCRVKKYLDDLAHCADLNRYYQFYLTPIGTGIAGFSHEEIKSILPKFPKNVILPKEFIN